MTALRMYHLRCEVIDQLSKLTLEEIEDVSRNFQRLHPEDYARYSNLFFLAKQRKYDELSMKEIIALADKQKNAPSSATNTEQGNM